MSLVNWTRLKLATLILFCVSPKAFGELYLEVRETLPIYLAPKPSAKSVGAVKPGQTLKHTGRRSTTYIEVLLPTNERVFIRRADMVKSKIVTSGSLQRKKPRMSWGGFVALSYYSQADREIQTATDTYYDATKFIGTGPLFGGYFESIIDAKWSAVVSLSRRQLHLEGEAVLRGSIAGGASEFRLTQEFISLGIGLKRYLNDRLWLSGYFELAKGTAVELEVLSGTQVDSSAIEKPFFTVGSGGIGYDYNFKSYRLQPFFRVGAIPFADPFILVVDMGLAADF